MLLDWEYAHVADPFWDVAGWSANNHFSLQEQEDWLFHYLSRAPNEGERRRFSLLSWLYDYVAWLWSRRYLDVVGASREIVELTERLDARLRLAAH